MSNDVNDFLAGGTKVPSAKFSAVGDTVVGIITELDVTQAREFGTNDLAFWSDGRAKEQLVVTLQTEQRDSTVEDDDGRRRIFAVKPSELLRAIAAVSKEAGKPLAVGGKLAVRHTGTKAAEKAGYNPVKLYEAAYTPPADSANDMLGSESNVSQAAAPASSVENLV